MRGPRAAVARTDCGLGAWHGDRNMTFKVDRMPAVNSQIRQLAERAKKQHIWLAYLDALNRMIDQLTNNPLDWVTHCTTQRPPVV
jgi:hypothetical protein